MLVVEIGLYDLYWWVGIGVVVVFGDCSYVVDVFDNVECLVVVYLEFELLFVCWGLYCIDD